MCASEVDLEWQTRGNGHPVACVAVAAIQLLDAPTTQTYNYSLWEQLGLGGGRFTLQSGYNEGYYDASDISVHKAKCYPGARV